MRITPTFTPVDFNPFEEDKTIEKITFTNDSQKEIWLSCMIGEKAANLSYNESVSLELEGQCDTASLERAVADLILRHEALRSTISPDGNTVIIYRNLPHRLDLQDLSSLQAEEQKAVLHAFLEVEIGTPMDLQQGPLFRVFFHKLGENKYLLTLIKHHVIGDGWSTGVMMEDISKMYNAYRKGENVSVGRPHQISDYAVAQISYKLTQEYRDTEDYWLGVFEDNVPLVDLPVDRERKSPRSYDGNRIDYPLSKELVQRLKLIGAKAGSSLVTTLLSAFELFLFQKTGQRDLIVGLPAAGQAAAGMAELVGHCVNLLPLKSEVDPEKSFVAYLKKRKTEVLDAYDHQRMTFGELVKKLYIPRDSSRVTLVPVIFNIDMGMDQAVAFDSLTHTLISNPRNYEHFELYLNATGSKNGIILEWSYNTALFDKETIDSFHRDYLAILEKVAVDPNLTISELLPAPAEQGKLYLNEDIVSIPVEKTLVSIVEDMVLAQPDAVALRFNDASLNYRDLNEQANQLANFLISNNVKPADKVALAADRSMEMIIALLAILKTGSAYIPLDASYPQERIAFVLQNSTAKCLLVSKRSAETYVGLFTNSFIIEDALTEARSLEKANINAPTTPDSLVYILHTSGSTGNPKGVCMGQTALVNLLLWQKEHSIASHQSKTLQFSPLSFDVSFQEIFATFSTGGTLVLIPEELRLDPFSLLDLLQEENVNRIFLPFVALQAIAESAGARNLYPASLNEVMTAGEQLKITPQIVNFFSKLPESVLYNQYGPTEAHVVTELKLSGDPGAWPDLPSIGTEIFNTKIFILNERLQEVEGADIGELCISGLCLAEGYLNLAEMTNEKFTVIPGSSVRTYRTGDLARRLQDGNIEFLGRQDHQVKIRGYRIELGEIEAHLNKQEGVKQAVVHAHEDSNGQKKLIAYLTTDSTELLKVDKISWHDRWNAIYDLGIQSEQRQSNPSGENLDKLILKQISNSDVYDDQADEWIMESAKRIRSIGASRILEIGCGGGQFITELAADVEQYFATDYSEVAISYINEKLGVEPEKWKHVSAIVAEASDFSKISRIVPNLVLINSVIQYFPNAKYLLDVITQAADRISKGCIFIGDVQGQATLRMHHGSEQLVHSEDRLTIGEFNERVDRRIAIEDELLVDPAFFYYVRSQIPQIDHVEVQLRKGQHLNETTKYHYDVWLYINTAMEIAKPDVIIKWDDFSNGLSGLEEKLVGLPLQTLIVSGIPNLRTRIDHALLRLLNQQSIDNTVAELRVVLEKEKHFADFDPDFFWELGEKLGYQTHVRWSDDGTDGCFEVVFIPHTGEIRGCIPPTQLSPKYKIEDFEATVNVIRPADTHLLTTWKNNLKTHLPEYMVPSEFVILNKLPLTATGKIDRKTLPLVASFNDERKNSSFVAPRTASERLIANIWSNVLNIKEISVDSDFFQLGGHSLIAVKVMVAIEKETGKRLPLASLFENSTIEKLASYIVSEEEEINWNSLIPIKKTGNKMPIYMVHGGGLNILVFNSLGRYMDAEQPVYGMQALGLDGKSEVLHTMEELADRYNTEILDNDPVGPYALAGYSFGGLLAYEMAKRLMVMGKEVKMLGILDTYAGGRDVQEGVLAKIIKKIIRQFRKLYFFGGLFLENPGETINYQSIVLNRKIKKLFNNGKAIKYDSVFTYEDRIYESYDKAWKNYLMEPLDIHVDVFKTKKRVYFLDDSVYLGWKAYAKKGVDVHEIPGDHKTFLFDPYDKEFAAVLQSVLNKRA
jgi:amino acid adenylation domain-containing protein